MGYRSKRSLGGRSAVLLWLTIFTLVTRGLGQQSAPKPGEPPVVHGGTVENWSSLPLTGGELRPEKPTFGEKDDKPLFTRELIQVKWRQGDPIDLYIIKPKGVAKPPIVLYLYSYPSESDRFLNDDYCVRLTRDGVAAIGFVSALTGHRYAMRPMKEWFVSELQEALGKSVHDVQMILNFLSDREDLDLSRVGMFGAGSGGTIAILSAAVDPRIQAVDLLDPWGDWPKWMAESSIIPENERPDYLKPEFLKKVEPLEPIHWLPQLKSTRIRIVDVMDDAVTPQEAKEKLDAAAPPMATVVRYQDSGKFFQAVSGGRMFDWVKDQVRPAVAEKPPAQNVSTTQPATRRVEPGHDD